ncbi:hypothetical protein SFRURICE_016616 [Spodoptera frugiperda]|nr:hypothetical protein SFRURICE_016616 [Spodoptera frugiperda]
MAATTVTTEGWECPAWAEHRLVLRDVVGGGDLSRPALVQAMVRTFEGTNLLTPQPSRDTLQAAGIALRSLATVNSNHSRSD